MLVKDWACASRCPAQVSTLIAKSQQTHKRTKNVQKSQWCLLAVKATCRHTWMRDLQKAKQIQQCRRLTTNCRLIQFTLKHSVRLISRENCGEKWWCAAVHTWMLLNFIIDFIHLLLPEPISFTALSAWQVPTLNSKFSELTKPTSSKEKLSLGLICFCYFETNWNSGELQILPSVLQNAKYHTIHRSFQLKWTLRWQ